MLCIELYYLIGRFIKGINNKKEEFEFLCNLIRGHLSYDNRLNLRFTTVVNLLLNEYCNKKYCVTLFADISRMIIDLLNLRFTTVVNLLLLNIDMSV